MFCLCLHITKVLMILQKINIGNTLYDQPFKRRAVMGREMAAYIEPSDIRREKATIIIHVIKAINVHLGSI